MVLVFLVYSPYSYSRDVYGQTGNAAASGLSWTMAGVLPEQAGLRVSDIIYRYRTQKDVNADMLVYVQNESAVAPGYVFRSVDDWSGIPGNTINKLVPVGLLPLEVWGSGSIQVDGEGQVLDPLVVYNYQYDPCFDPQSSPSCPGYVPEYAPEPIDPLQYVKDPLEDELILAELEKKPPEEDEEDEEDSRRMQAMLMQMERLETMLGGVNAKLVTAEAQIQYEELLSLNFIPTTYTRQLKGGSYEDSIKYADTEIPTNKRATRVGLAQELLHQEMVNSQYER